MAERKKVVGIENLIIDVTGQCKRGTNQWTKYSERVSIDVNLSIPSYIAWSDSLQGKGRRIFFPRAAFFLHKTFGKTQGERGVDDLFILIGRDAAVDFRIV